MKGGGGGGRTARAVRSELPLRREKVKQCTAVGAKENNPV